MSNGNGSRWLWIVFALIVGFVLGTLFRRPQDGGENPKPTPIPQPTMAVTAPPIGPTPTCVPWGVTGSHNVVVGPQIAVCNPDCLSLTYSETVSWAGMSTDDLWIEFPDKPFKTMYPGVIKPNRADCAGNTCRSGAVVTNAPTGWYPCPTDPTHKCKDFKYWQVFHNNATGQNTYADGRLIIKW